MQVGVCAWFEGSAWRFLFSPRVAAARAFGMTQPNLGFGRATETSLEEAKVLLEKDTRKSVRNALTGEKSKIETEIQNKMQQKS